MSVHIEFDDGAELFISSKVINDTSRLIVKKGFETESGGILIGRQLLQSLSFEIVFASMPNINDISKQFSFIREKDAANKLIASAWEQSGGSKNYLGEWHTHNQALPVPSLIDRNLMLQIVNDGSCLFDRSFMIILGYSNCAYIGAVNPYDKLGIYSERIIKWN